MYIPFGYLLISPYLLWESPLRLLRLITVLIDCSRDWSWWQYSLNGQHFTARCDHYDRKAVSRKT